MLKHMKEENGEFSIDAIFGITFFMITLIVVMFFSLIVRVQSNIQYALGQTAKEISGYYYLVDKIGLAEITSGNTQKTDIDNTIDNIIDFSTEIKDTASGITGHTVHDAGIPIDLNSIQSLKDDYSNIQDVYNDFQGIVKDVKGLNGDSFKQVLSVFTKTAANRAVSTFIAPFISEKLMTKYLTSGDIHEYYESMGITDVDFRGSQFLADKRSIKVEMCYKMNVKKFTLGLVDMDLSFRQVASTAAWVRPDNEEKNLISISKLSQLYASDNAENAEQEKGEGDNS